MSDATCRDCGVSKPASEFYRDRSRKSGLNPYCKECKNRRCRESYARRVGRAPDEIRRYRRDIDVELPGGVTLRMCWTCSEQRPLDAFHRDGSKRNGRGYECKDCQRVRVRDYSRRRKAETGEWASASWRVKHGHETYGHTCEMCGSTWKSQNRGSRFCSSRCYGDSIRKTPRPDIVPFVGEPTVCLLPARHPARQRGRQPRPRVFVEGPCGWCRNRFTIVDQREARYCSSRCAGAAGKSRGGRFTVPPHIRQGIYERDGWVCQLCSDPVDPDLPTSDVWAATLDHVVPQSWTLVPDHRPENLRLAHRWCNSVRGDESYYTEEVLRHAA